MTIHSTAIIDPTATLGIDINIGPYCVVGPNCVVGDGVTLLAHAVLEENVRLGARSEVGSFTVLGGKPQDTSFKGETTFVDIGEDAVIRETVTVNRSTGEGTATTLGDRCFLMAGCHVAHNSTLGDDVIFANQVLLAGYCSVGDFTFIGGQTVVHQHVQIGENVIISGASGTRQDVPHYAMCDGRPLEIRGINKVGLRRRNYTTEQRRHIQRAYDILWFSEMDRAQAIEHVREELGSDLNIVKLLDFVQGSKRGIRRVREERPLPDEEEASSTTVTDEAKTLGAV